MVKPTRHNSIFEEQQYTYTSILKILTLVTDSTFIVKWTRRNSTFEKQQ